MHGRQPRFKGAVANGATRYVPIPIPPSGRTTIDIAWKDAVSAAAITLETTLFNNEDAPVDAAGPAYGFKPEAAVAITGPAAAAIGSSKVHVSNLGDGVRARLKIVATANCDFEIYST